MSARFLFSMTVVAFIVAAGCTSTRPTTADSRVDSAAVDCRQTAGENRRAVLAFYDLGLVRRQPGAAFERYVSPEFVEHKPDVERGDRESTVRFLEALIADLPQGRWEVLRSAAEGDLVFVHARFTPAPGAPPYAIADVFRLRNCRIVEHWDVVAGPPANARNPVPRF